MRQRVRDEIYAADEDGQFSSIALQVETENLTYVYVP